MFEFLSKSPIPGCMAVDPDERQDLHIGGTHDMSLVINPRKARFFRPFGHPAGVRTGRHGFCVTEAKLV